MWGIKAGRVMRIWPFICHIIRLPGGTSRNEAVRIAMDF